MPYIKSRLIKTFNLGLILALTLGNSCKEPRAFEERTMPQRDIRLPTESDIGKLETMVVKVPSAEIAAQFGRRPAAPPVEFLKLLLTKPEKLKRNHSGPDPGPSGFDWPND